MFEFRLYINRKSKKQFNFLKEICQKNIGNGNENKEENTLGILFTCLFKFINSKVFFKAPANTFYFFVSFNLTFFLFPNAFFPSF